MSNSKDVPDAAWKQLLIATQSLSGGSPNPTRQMSAEDREFIEGGMSQMVQKTDPVRQMIHHINELHEMKEPLDANIEKLEIIIDELESIICQIDCAVDFCKLGGVKEIERLMNCKCNAIRTEVMRLLPTILQNNPNAQELSLKSNLLPSLVSILRDEEEASEVKIKALSATSALVRGYDEAYSVFRRLNGFNVVGEIFDSAFSTGNEKLLNKAAITITSIANDLGYESSLDHGLPTTIIKMYFRLPPNSMALSYLRSYLSENIKLEKIDEENRMLIMSALERDLKIEHESEEPDMVAVQEIEEMLEKLKK